MGKFHRYPDFLQIPLHSLLITACHRVGTNQNLIQVDAYWHFLLFELKNYPDSI